MSQSVPTNSLVLSLVLLYPKATLHYVRTYVRIKVYVSRVGVSGDK